MKRITISVDVPDWVDEKEFEEKVKELVSKLLYPRELTFGEVREIFGVVEEEIEYVNVRRKERDRLKWLYSILRK